MQASFPATRQIQWKQTAGWDATPYTGSPGLRDITVPSTADAALTSAPAVSRLHAVHRLRIDVPHA
jgi:hypothetical protein